MKIDLAHEVPQRDKGNHLKQSGHPKLQLWDKAVQKLQVDDQTKIPCDFPDNEDTGIASVPPLPRRNRQKGTFLDQGGDTICESRQLHRIPRPSHLMIRKRWRNVQTNTLGSHLKNPGIHDGGSPK
ncbi:hypothetical protein NDU88_005298 [Pleurodeles waltl]|uniref:Uncharacterized protein n=1 Tax=Pleurodeles waltl TaxID=8319 RepID=A0AAV7NM00_PLEWA|nr:hypothetical protein NDU88_005298 [Pleurodeles waltl]